MQSDKIIVVDDSLASLKLMSLVLIRGGFDVRHAMTADEALTAIEKDVPDLLLMNLRMPHTDGLSLARELKAAKATEDLIIVALTNDELYDDDEKALAWGCSGFLAKPIDTHTFADHVASFLEKPERIFASKKA